MKAAPLMITKTLFALPVHNARITNRGGATTTARIWETVHWLTTETSSALKLVTEISVLMPTPTSISPIHVSSQNTNDDLAAPKSICRTFQQPATTELPMKAAPLMITKTLFALPVHNARITNRG